MIEYIYDVLVIIGYILISIAIMLWLLLGWLLEENLFKANIKWEEIMVEGIKFDGIPELSYANHPSIVHEMVHVKIHKFFGFKKWRINLSDEDELVCVMTLPEEVLFPKYLPKLFLWNIMHLVHDIFLRFFCFDVLNIIIYMKEFILINRKIIKESKKLKNIEKK